MDSNYDIYYVYPEKAVDIDFYGYLYSLCVKSCIIRELQKIMGNVQPKITTLACVICLQ